jgi:hypothetical protein
MAGILNMKRPGRNRGACRAKSRGQSLGLRLVIRHGGHFLCFGFAIRRRVLPGCCGPSERKMAGIQPVPAASRSASLAMSPFFNFASRVTCEGANPPTASRIAAFGTCRK